MMNLTSLKASDFIGIIISIILIYVAKFYYNYFTRPNPLPGSIPLPFVGNIFEIAYYAKGDTSAWYKLLNEKYGNIFEYYIGSSRNIVLNRADHLEKLMSSSKTSNYIKNSKSFSTNDGIQEKGIVFNSHIPTWKFNRQFLAQIILAPSFSKEALYWTPKFFEELNECWKGIRQDEPIDFSIWIHKFTTDIIFKMFVGIDVNSMTKYFNQIVELSKKKHVLSNPIDDEIENFAELVDNYLIYMKFSLKYPSFIKKTLLRKENNKLQGKYIKTTNLLNKVIDYRRNEIEQTPINEELRNDMLTSLITTNTERDITKHKHAEEEYSKPLTNDKINEILLDSLSGGIDTTANLLCYIVYHLNHHPDVLARLRQELDSIFGLDPNRQITMEDLSKMDYTEAIIKESSRLVTVVKEISRVSESSDTIGGYQWPAQTSYLVYIEGIHQNPNYWKDPHKFNPDRFMEAGPQKNTFLMFGGGIRACPGRKFALIEMKCLIALIYRNLDITLVDMNAPLKLKNDIVNVCTELKVRVKQREESRVY